MIIMLVKDVLVNYQFVQDLWHGYTAGVTLGGSHDGARARVLGQTVSQLIRNVIDRPPALPYKDTLVKNNCC